MNQGQINIENMSKLREGDKKLRKKIELSMYLSDSQKKSYYARLDEIAEQRRELHTQMQPGGEGTVPFYSQKIENTLSSLEDLNTSFNEDEKAGLGSQITSLRSFNSTPSIGGGIYNPEPNRSESDANTLDDTPNQNEPRRR